MKLVTLNITAPTPVLIQPAAERFNKLRAAVLKGCGHDFLAKCGDVMRPASFRSTKDGVDNRSWHKTGRAFDYDQESRLLVIVSEPTRGGQYFRTYLKCANQTGKQGVKRRVRDYRGYYVDAYLFDFTAAAEGLDFRRIPAWSGWQTRYNRREFWHYQFNPEGLSWDAAMRQISGLKAITPAAAAAKAVYGLNDRGDAVREIQQRLNELRVVSPSLKADGVYGPKTAAAVRAFQKANKLAIDGLVGPDTRKALGLK